MFKNIFFFRGHAPLATLVAMFIGQNLNPYFNPDSLEPYVYELF